MKSIYVLVQYYCVILNILYKWWEGCCLVEHLTGEPNKTRVFIKRILYIYRKRLLQSKLLAPIWWRAVLLVYLTVHWNWLKKKSWCVMKIQFFFFVKENYNIWFMGMGKYIQNHFYFRNFENVVYLSVWIQKFEVKANQVRAGRWYNLLSEYHALLRIEAFFSKSFYTNIKIQTCAGNKFYNFL